MTTGEKIKYFRNMRGISQETLGQLSGINSATIKKYEYGIRNPKPDQLLKIANALGISINIFITREIVELHGGTIRCQSRMEEIQFIIELPDGLKEN